jgi:hypothetical protein
MTPPTWILGYQIHPVYSSHGAVGSSLQIYSAVLQICVYLRGRSSIQTARPQATIVRAYDATSGDLRGDLRGDLLTSLSL